MPSLYTTIVFLLAGVVHLLPVPGMLGPAQLERLYGIDLANAEPSLVILMRHRAALFGVVGVALLAGAWRPELRPMTGALGMFSMLSYIALARGAPSPSLLRVWWIDVVLAIALAIALLLPTE